MPRRRPAQNIQLSRNHGQGQRRVPFRRNWLHRVQRLGCRRLGQDSESHAGAPPEIRRQSAPRLGYSGSRLFPRPRCGRRYHERSPRCHGHFARVRATKGFRAVTDLSQPVQVECGDGSRPSVQTDEPRGDSRPRLSKRSEAPQNGSAAPVAEASPGRPQSARNDSDFPFSIELGEIYEGPLDLLLDLIRKQDIDIYDIPIAKITAQFLTYVERIRQFDVNVASEFIYMAAVLIHIKSKMLLPRDPLAPAGTEEDPRNELVNRLLEHEKFKAAAQMLLQKQQIEDAVLSNPSLKE